MKHASLFSGIGGFDLAAEWCGWENVFQVEWNDYCQKILKQNFPDAKRHRDIKDFDGTPYRRKIDVISGGFPCQPFSVAGKRKGTEDDRYLWPEMLRVIQEVQPRYVVGENVGGLVSWNDGLVFEQVLSDLENEGFAVGAYILPACAVNAPHRRDRVWIIANTRGERCDDRVHSGEERHIQEKQNRDASESKPERDRREHRAWADDNDGTAANSQCERQQEPGEIIRPVHTTPNQTGETGGAFGVFNGDWGGLPKPGISRSDDGLSDRMDRTKALGNAIVPQVAYNIFKSLERKL
ncbi:MAG: DNA (cytosine-5-)-methyltransferase [Deltaproteobacteria bacterium]|jgi:DNA (cytosine-5)-methyltransferase 1|uniref:Cytosine-specific methyltransferase n=1 Tax=uncultured marine virus TaxID=186617 RepID=A0A0F7L3U1_9VIRU|nr:hypothetical protein [uncultured marine virus]MBT4088512.1 DNA (cytosine-5-)-methyltransferase [Deltaproteobacteria bacterium]